MQKYEYKQLRVTDLLLNTQNPRFDPVQHQAQAIHAMIEDQGDKLTELAKHIASNGFSPMEIVLVQPIGTQWLVREGNRRVTALKLINEPELIPDSYAKMKREFSVLNKKADSSILDSILCVICDDEDTINAWILLKHTGENKGIGTVGWDAYQISRFASMVSGKTDPKASFFDVLKEMTAIPKPIRDKFPAIKKTNYDRLLGDPGVRDLLGIDFNNGIFSLPRGINAYFLTVLNDLTGEFSVGRIYSKKDRKAYMDDVKSRVDNIEPTGTSSQFDRPEVKRTPNAGVSSNENMQHSNPVAMPDVTSAETAPQNSDLIQKTEKTKESKKAYPIKRKTLIPAQHKLAIGNPRIARIFTELKKLECEQYPNAVSVLFRVFVELSCDCYIATNSITGVNADSRLGIKIEAVANDIESKKLMTKNELRTARQMATGQTQNQSVKTFHSYVHNKDVTPIATDLLVAWDDLFPFIENMWR